MRTTLTSRNAELEAEVQRLRRLLQLVQVNPPDGENERDEDAAVNRDNEILRVDANTQTGLSNLSNPSRETNAILNSNTDIMNSTEESNSGDVLTRTEAVDSSRETNSIPNNGTDLVNPTTATDAIGLNDATGAANAMGQAEERRSMDN